MYIRPKLLQPAVAVSLVVLLVAIGCGGSGGGTGGATTGSGTGTSTGSSTTTTSGGTAGTMSLIPALNPAFITEQRQSVALTLTYHGTPGATFQWEVDAPEQSPTGIVFATPGSEGTLMTVDGQPFPTGPTTLTQAVYVGNPAQFTFGGFDRIFVQSILGPNSEGLNASTTVSMSSDYVTLPGPITSAVGSVTLDHSSYKPGDTVTASIHVIPSLNNGAMSLVAPVGFTPANVMINGVGASLPASYHYGPFDAAFNLTLTFVIPAGTPNEFPVSGSTSGQTGPWMMMSASNWTIEAPFFIHA